MVARYLVVKFLSENPTHELAIINNTAAVTRNAWTLRKIEKNAVI